MKKIVFTTILITFIATGILAGSAMAQNGGALTQTVTKSGSQPSSVGSAAVFTGNVFIDPLFDRKAGVAEFSAAYVTFAPGARSFWHTYPAGQHLVVTKGMGWTGLTDGTKTVIQAGDVIWCPPGVKHWHGATNTTAMTHMAITGYLDGQNVEWLEAVSDEQYND